MKKRALPVAIEDEIRTYVESRPPPAPLMDARARLEARYDTPSAILDIDDLQRQVREAAIAAVADKVDVEREKRLLAEGSLRRLGERFWTVVTGVLVVVIGAGVLWAFAALVKK